MKCTEYSDYEVEFLAETWEGILVFDGDSKVWLPKSQLKHLEENTHREGDMITITLPDWLAEKKNMC